ncbi:MAG: hypothetical protein CVV03_06885 [Firmicutes bacterium HGW-Firmicutes-8]|nr:MAG: hypothetical protein CVV03_06885 [Firmicutes bacterium HGW-Firmicutes-8]
MNTLFITKNRLWFIGLLAGICLLGLGLFQTTLSFYGRSGSSGPKEPAAGTQVNQESAKINQEAAKGRPVEKAGGSTEKREARQNEFFVEYRLERDRTRSQQIDLLREIVNNGNSAQETRGEANRRLLAISQAIEIEMKLENLIKAENFKDAVVFVQDKSVTIIVQTPVLTAVDKNKLTEIAVRATGLNGESVTVIPKV